jgi:uncharacterized protein YuzE
MDFQYDKDTDSLYIALSPRKSVESEEVSDGLIIDYDDTGHIVGLDIQHASKQISLSNASFSGFLPSIDTQTHL